MRTVRGSAVLGLAIGLLAAAGAQAQLAVSDFAIGDDGWETVANQNAPVLWQTGVISQQDIHYGIMAFKAPSKYLGNKSAAYGGTFTFEMSTSALKYAPSNPKLRISGNTPDGSYTFKIALPRPSTPGVFQSYTVRFDETDDWNFVGQKRAPTSDEFQAILASLTDIRIIGDTSAQDDEMFAIRNIRLDPPEQPEPEPGSLKVFIMAGQSNMAGCDDVRNVDPMWQSDMGDVMMYWGNDFAPAFTGLKSGTSGASCSDGAPQYYFGPELAFGSDVSLASPEEQVVIIKFAVGGTDMFEYWTTPTREFPNGGVLWNQLQDVMGEAFTKLDTMGYDYHVEAFLWMQGESDSDKKYRAKAYAKNLTSFISSMRYFVDDPEMPFILGRIRDAGQPHADMVRQAQVDVANNIPNVYWFDTDDLPFLPDGIHYNEAGMIELGHRFADVVMSLP